jgi:Fe-S-cluster containining protein
MSLKKEALPVPCSTAKEWKICVESWKFFKTSSLDALRQELSGFSSDTFEKMYKSAIMIQGRNAALDDDIGFITLEHARNGHRTPCHSGCSACCKQAITATPFEAALVGIYLTGNPAICDNFVENYIRWDVETRNMRDNFLDWAQQMFSMHTDSERYRYTDFRAPCPFLADDLCQIYPVRPYCCRSYLAISNRCKSPSVPDEMPGFGGIDAASYTDFKRHNNTLHELVWNLFGIDQKKTRVRLLPELVYRFIVGDVDNFLEYCLSAS